MGKPGIRETTTRSAVKRINRYLKQKEYAAALLFSAIYVHIRLKSVLTDRIQPPAGRWEEVANNWSDLFSFNAAVNVCEELNLLRGMKARQLKDIWKLRSVIAHESKLWRKPSQEEIDNIVSSCKVAIDFLERTSDNP